MGLTQNQDTIKTLRMVIFLIVIETLIFMSSAVMTYASTGKNVYNFEGGNSEATKLVVSDFKWYDYRYLGGFDIYTNVYISEHGGELTSKSGSPILIIEGVKKGDFITLQKRIDSINEVRYQHIQSGSAVDTVRALFDILTFKFLTFPFNIVPILTSTIIGLIIAYFLFTEIKSWIPDWL